MSRRLQPHVAEAAAPYSLKSSTCHVSQRMPVCHGSVRHTRQKLFAQSGHSSLQPNAVKAEGCSCMRRGLQPQYAVRPYDLLTFDYVLAVVHVERKHELASSRGAAAHALVRLGYQTHAASTAYGCSLHHLWLQPAPPTVAASTAYGCRLECPRPRLDAALQREPFVPCHGLGRLQAARHVRWQEGRVTLGLNARAAELLGLGVARRKVAGQGWPPRPRAPRAGGSGEALSRQAAQPSPYPRRPCPARTARCNPRRRRARSPRARPPRRAASRTCRLDR